MHRIIPDLIIENYRARRHHGTFTAASMFLDISGFSTMADTLMQHGQHGSEVLARMMQAVFDPIVNAIFEQDGMLVGYAGDAITALYPADTDSAPAALRALASANTIQKGLSSKPIFETPYGSFRISAKIGLAAGLVSWGILRSRDDRKATYYFRGEAVEEASQAEHQASAGEIILSPVIFEQLRGDVVTDPAGSFHRLRQVPGSLPAPRPIDLPPVDVEIASILAPHPSLVKGVRGEFRQSVHLFMRIPNPGDEQLEQLMHVLFDLQARYGGVIDRIDYGDKGCNMIVVWGAPVAYENDIGRALNFTLDLQSQISLPVTAGITYYISHAGYIGGRLYENYTCYGWGINLASRFMMSAPMNEVWVDERVVQRVSRRFWFDYVGEQNFKGFARKQKVYVLRGRKAEPESFFLGDIHGREAELQKLTDFVEPLWSGKFAGLLGVWGEAGIGKSRLVHEFMHAPVFPSRRSLWALCQSDQILRQSFNPLRYWLFHYFDFLPADEPEARLRKFYNKLEDVHISIRDESLATELKRTRSFLAALVDLYWPNSLYEQMDAQGRYDNTILALISLLKAESLRQPLILFMEDIHFLDEDSKNFISRLKRALLAETISYPIAVIMTMRWEATMTVFEDNLIDRDIDLAGLSALSFAHIARDILGRDAAPALLDLVVQRADGNPFFAEQVLRYLQDESLLEDGPFGITLRTSGKLSVLPADINKMLIARLDQLTLQVKEVVHAASVLGREFEIHVLARMLQDEPYLNDEISQAEEARVWSPLSEIRYIFNHALLRDVAYNMQLESRRQELHALAFHSLEELYGAEIHRHYGELAYHSEQAKLGAEARLYLRKAGDSARDTYLNSEAIDYYSRALAVTPPGGLVDRYTLYLDRAAIYGRRGERGSQAKDLDELEVVARQLGGDKYLAEVHMLRAEYFYATGEFAASIASVEQVRDYLEREDCEKLLLAIYITWSNSLMRLGRAEEAMGRAQVGLSRMRRSGIRLEEGRMLSSMGLIALELNDPEMAREYLVEAVAIARDLENLELEGKALNNLANAAGFGRGDFALARDYYEQAFTKVHERGDRYGEGLIISNLGWCAGMQGDFPAARAYLKQALAIAREVGNTYQETYTLINLSAVSGIQEETAEALEFASRAYEMSVKINDLSSQAWAFLYLGHAYLLAGEFEKAEQAYEESVRIRKDLKQPGLAMEAVAGLIQSALERDLLPSALQDTESILAYLAGGGTLEGTEEPLRIFYACYLALERTKDPRTLDVLKSAVQLLDAQVSKFSDEPARRMYVENVPWRLAIQNAWEAHSHARTEL